MAWRGILAESGLQYNGNPAGTADPHDPGFERSAACPFDTVAETDADALALCQKYNHGSLAGVLALFADSTNIDRRGFTGSERDVVDAGGVVGILTRTELARAGVLGELDELSLPGRQAVDIASDGRGPGTGEAAAKKGRAGIFAAVRPQERYAAAVPAALLLE